MRKLTRTAAPDCLQRKAAHWTAKYIDAKNKNPAHKFNWKKHGTCSELIRQSLSDMTQQHCAFCDGILRVTSPDTIEHFKPKKTFPELAYAWDNLFPCCCECQRIKKERFDESLLKPDDQDYDFNSYFTVNYRTGEIELCLHADNKAQTRARVTLELYGLNSKERMNARIQQMEHFSKAEKPFIDDYNYRFFLE